MAITVLYSWYMWKKEQTNQNWVYLFVIKETNYKMGSVNSFNLDVPSTVYGSYGLYGKEEEN